jgi:hypothetical protein
MIKSCMYKKYAGCLEIAYAFIHSTLFLSFSYTHIYIIEYIYSIYREILEIFFFTRLFKFESVCVRKRC